MLQTGLPEDLLKYLENPDQFQIVEASDCVKDSVESVAQSNKNSSNSHLPSRESQWSAIQYKIFAWIRLELERRATKLSSTMWRRQVAGTQAGGPTSLHNKKSTVTWQQQLKEPSQKKTLSKAKPKITVSSLNSMVSSERIRRGVRATQSLDICRICDFEMEEDPYSDGDEGMNCGGCEQLVHWSSRWRVSSLWIMYSCRVRGPTMEQVQLWNTVDCSLPKQMRQFLVHVF